jgi:hypothetical protein
LSEVIGTVQRVPGVAYVDVDTFGGVPEKTTRNGQRLPLSPSEISGKIKKLVESKPLLRVTAGLAVSDDGLIRPAQLAFLTPDVPDTLILQEITP